MHCHKEVWGAANPSYLYLLSTFLFLGKGHRGLGGEQGAL